MAATAQLRRVWVESGRPGSAKLYAAVQRLGLGIKQAEVRSFVKEQGTRQIFAPIPKGAGKVTSVRLDDKWQADLIIVYHNRHREINEMFSKSCSQRVADHATCSVLRLRNVQSST